MEYFSFKQWLTLVKGTKTLEGSPHHFLTLKLYYEMSHRISFALYLMEKMLMSKFESNHQMLTRHCSQHLTEQW